LLQEKVRWLQQPWWKHWKNRPAAGKEEEQQALADGR
jgi:hypothetical protein